MDEKILQLRVGIFVLLAMMILAFLIFLFNDNMLMGQYKLYLKTVAAPGVTANTPIRKNGVLIGRVKDVVSGDEDVTIVLNIYDDVNVYSDEYASIGMDSFLGDAVVEILPLPVDQRGQRLEPDQQLTNVTVKRNPLEVMDIAVDMASDMQDTMGIIKKSANSFSSVSEKIDKLLGDDEAQELRFAVQQFTLTNQRVQAATESLDEFFGNLNGVVGQPQVQNNLRGALSQLLPLANQVLDTIKTAKLTIKEVGGNATENLENLKPLTKSLGSEGADIVTRINANMGKLDALFTELEGVTTLLRNLQSSEGTVGKLLNDPALYNSALETVDNVRVLSTRLEPLVNDLRMFADSIARDPGQLGVRGAISNKGQAPKTGYKGIIGSGFRRE